MSGVSFNLKNKEPYLTEIIGLTTTQVETLINKGYPILMTKPVATILTSMEVFFAQEIKTNFGINDVFLNRAGDTGKISFKVNLLHLSNDFVQFCEIDPIPKLFLELLQKKVQMKSYPSYKCLLVSKKYVNFLKKEKHLQFTESVLPEKEAKSISIANLNTLSSFFGDKKNYVKFRGSYVWEWGWLLYLEKELGAEIVCVWKGTSGDGGIAFGKEALRIKPWVIEELKRCFKAKSRFTIGIMEIKLDTGVLHANGLIFDTKNKLMTRFEPHGAGLEVNYNVGELDTQLEKWMKKHLDASWEYRAPIHFCPVTGPQTVEAMTYYEKKMKNVFNEHVDLEKEAGGFCSAWSLLFLHYRLVNPNLSDKEISEYMVSESGEILFNRIREYVAFIVKTVDPHWSVEEKRKILSEGDNVQFKKSKEETEYGKIVVLKETAIVFAINNLKQKSKDGDLLEFKFYNVQLGQLTLIDEDVPSKIVAEVERKVKIYAKEIRKVTK